MKILSELNAFHKKIFQQIIERKFNLQKPGSKKLKNCFWECLEDLQNFLRNLDYTYRLEDVKKSLVEIYTCEARKRGITPSVFSLEKKQKEQRSLFLVHVTPVMRRGAKRIDYRHHKILGDDY